MWDSDKQRVIGGAPAGAFVLGFEHGESLPGDWWCVRDGDGIAVGYGRLDTTWGGDAEILLAAAPDRQQSGVGSFILARLDEEAASRGINYVHNRIRDHSQRDYVHDWLVVRGFRGPVDGDLRKRVGPTYERAALATGPIETYDASRDPTGQAPGDEEQGGYVNVEQHEY